MVKIKIHLLIEKIDILIRLIGGPSPNTYHIKHFKHIKKIIANVGGTMAPKGPPTTSATVYLNMNLFSFLRKLFSTPFFFGNDFLSQNLLKQD